MDLWKDNELFSISNSYEQYYPSIHNPLISELGEQCNILKQIVDENGLEDEFLNRMYLTIKRSLTIFSTSLVPFHQIESIDLQDLRYKFRELKVLYPNIYQDFLKGAEQIKKLLEQEQNLLIEKVLELVNGPKLSKRAIVTKRNLKNEEIYAILERFTKNAMDISFFNDSKFRKSSDTFDEVIFIGSQNLFETYANNCPRARKTYFISYDVFPNYFKNMEVLHSLQPVSTVYKGIKNKLEQRPTPTAKIILEEDLPSLSLLGRQLAAIEELDENDADSIEPVEARFITLENDHVLFLQVNGRYKVVEVDLKAKHVTSKPFNMLELDDFLLVFHERETEMLATVADSEILKEHAQELRNIQKSWKNRLQDWVDNNGIQTVCHILSSKYGMNAAKPQNVNYWLRDTTILPRNMEQLLKALQYDDDVVQQILLASNHILAAHRRAGGLVTQYANHVIKNSDLKNLLSQGYQIFSIPEFLGVTFSVERIVGISSEKFLVHPGKIMKVYNHSSIQV
ncbi:TPA: hypothetical protein QC445_004840 [Bacillus cereus]|uniref:hypothetical protein n=1 Tax=Bacillus thuringiensis TaxID=1428 RepID=UPI00119EE62D|nr:hypothetical protein [Bacillus thuringiensis]HDR8487963.1 hypothetical protein [Bacillus cereus]